MVKKLKILSTAVVFCFIAVLIPIAIMAANNVAPSISSTLQYLVEDIEGEFSYKIYGNADPATHDVSLAKLFYTAPNETTGHIEVLNSNNVVLPLGQAIQINHNGIVFDDTHRKVCFYFVFANTGENDPVIEDDDRSVDVRASSNNWSNFTEHISASWSYVIKQQNVGSPITEGDIDIDTNENTIQQGDADFALLSDVTIDPINTETQQFSYIIIKYELNLDDATSSFNTSMALTINLKSNQNSN